MHKKIGVIAGPYPFKIVFEDIITRQVAKRHGTDKEQGPPDSLRPEIDQYEKKQEQVQRRPVQGAAPERHDTVQQGMGPLAVDLYKQPFVPLQ